MVDKFYIKVINEGPLGQVIVEEYLNENMKVPVLDRLMEQNEVAENVECQGKGYKKFHWKNAGSGNEGNADKADGLTLHVDPQGKEHHR